MFIKKSKMNSEELLRQALLNTLIIETLQNSNIHFKENYIKLQNTTTNNTLDKINQLRIGAIELSSDFLNNYIYKNTYKSILRSNYDLFQTADKVLINCILSEINPLSDVTCQQLLEGHILHASYNQLLSQIVQGK